MSGSASSVADLALATDGTKIAAAWSQNIAGNREIYLREFSGGTWNALGGSASGGGVSATDGDSRAPSLAYHADSFFAAWQDLTSGRFEIYARRFNGTAWVEAGAGSASGGGISATGGEATQPQLAAGGGVLHLAWLDNRIASMTGNTTVLYAKRWNGSAFVEELGGDASHRGISPRGIPQAPALAADTAGHPFIAWQDFASGNPEIYIRGNVFDIGTVYYVNDAELLGDAITTAVGAATKDGRTRNTPKASIQQILDQYDLNPGDVILVDAGNYASAATIAVADSGVLILGSPNRPSTITGAVTINSATGVILQNLELEGGVTVRGGSDVTLVGNAIGGPGATVDGGTGVQVLHSTITVATGTGLMLTGGTRGAVVEHNVVTGGTRGIAVTGTGATDLEVRDNRLSGSTTGLEITSVGASNSYSSSVLADAALGYWRLGDAISGTAFDASGHGNTGTYLNGVTLGLTGALTNDADPAAGFDGADDYVSVADAPSLRPAQLTLEAWARPDAPLPGYATILMKSSTNSWTDGYGLYYDNTPGNISFFVNHWSANVVKGTLPAGQWSHVVGIYDGAMLRLFINGVQVASRAFSQSINHSLQPLGIGSGQGNYPWRGSLDEVAVYGTALSPERIKAHYDARIALGSSSGEAASSGQIVNNSVTATGTGLYLAARFNGTVASNEFQGATVGVVHGAPAMLESNRIHHNTNGVFASVSGQVDGFGFVGDALPNEIFANTTGVALTGQMQNQHIFANTTGVSGSGVLGGTDLEHANLIEANVTGVNVTGPIQFNRIARNTVGIVAQNGQLITHNLIYRNTQTALLVSGKSDVRIVSNTFYSPQGDNIRIESGASNVEVRSNILWAESGYDIYVANDSQSGFYSDYNDLYAGDNGTLVYWTKDFADVLDWQADVARFDLHSIGHTVVDPLWAEPHFMNRGQDDYRLFGQVAGLRFSSPTVNAADPLTDQGIPALYHNLLVNADFESGITGWTTHATATTRTADPASFTGANYFFAGNEGTGFAEQAIDLVTAGFTETALDSNRLDLVFGGRIRAAAESPVDQGEVRVAFLDASGNPLGETVAKAGNVSDRWELVGGRTAMPIGTRSVTFRFDAVRKSGSSNDSYLDHAFLYVVSEEISRIRGPTATLTPKPRAPTPAWRYASRTCIPIGNARNRTPSAGIPITTTATRRCASISTRTGLTARPCSPPSRLLRLITASTSGFRPVAGSDSAPTVCASRYLWSTTPLCWTAAPRASACLRTATSTS